MNAATADGSLHRRRPGLARLVQRGAGAARLCRSSAPATARPGSPASAAGGIDVIALDHYMPAGTGLDVLARMRDASPSRRRSSMSPAQARRGRRRRAEGRRRRLCRRRPSARTSSTCCASAIEQALEHRPGCSASKAQAEREMREAQASGRGAAARGQPPRRQQPAARLGAGRACRPTRSSDPAAKRRSSETQARIAAIAGVHRRLYTSRRCAQCRDGGLSRRRWSTNWARRCMQAGVAIGIDISPRRSMCRPTRRCRSA